jgi:hypothetical protein
MVWFVTRARKHITPVSLLKLRRARRSCSGHWLTNGRKKCGEREPRHRRLPSGQTRSSPRKRRRGSGYRMLCRGRSRRTRSDAHKHRHARIRQGAAHPVTVMRSVVRGCGRTRPPLGDTTEQAAGRTPLGGCLDHLLLAGARAADCFFSFYQTSGMERPAHARSHLGYGLRSLEA